MASAQRSESLTKRQQYWHDHLQRCSASGLSLRAYAAEQGLKVNSLYVYRKRLAGRAKCAAMNAVAKPRFVRAQGGSPTLPCRVHLRNGVTVELGVSDDQLGALLATVSALS